MDGSFSIKFMGLLLFSSLSILIFNVRVKIEMKYISTRNNNTSIDFERVSLKGLASDGGFYLPKDWNENNFKFSKNLK